MSAVVLDTRLDPAARREALRADVRRGLTATPKALPATWSYDARGSEPRARFLAGLAATLRPGDALLLGTDLVEDVARLEAAYDDARGVTAAFHKNVLAVIDRELDADLDPDAFDHVARWVPEHERTEMLLRSRRAQRAHVRALGLEVDLAEGEEIRTEVSSKFRRGGVEGELAAAGLRVRHRWEDPAGDVGVSLSVPG
nr:L-histidine N(alpha)-methyltransferase [Vallicoccus soli]